MRRRRSPTATARTSSSTRSAGLETFTQAFYACDLAGTAAGVPNPDWKIELPLIDVFVMAGHQVVLGTATARLLPRLPYVDLHLQGRLPLDKFVTETIGLDDVEEAFHKMHKGEVLRSVGPVSTPIDHVVTSGTFSLDGRQLGRRQQRVARRRRERGDRHRRRARPREDRLVAAVGTAGRWAIVCTHAHDDHVNRAPALVRPAGAPVYLHRLRRCWGDGAPDRKPDHDLLCDGDVLHAAIDL